MNKSLSFKEWFNNYKNWCKEGSKNKYGLMLLVLLLPMLIYFTYAGYVIGYSKKEIEETSKRIEELNNMQKY